MRPSTRIVVALPAAASGAATPGSLGPFPVTQWGFWGPSPWCNTHAGKRVPFCGSCASFSSKCQPGVRVVPFVRWPALGSPPFGTTHHCQVARGHRPTVPRGSRRACHTEGVHTTASGRQALAVRTQPLRDASPGSESSPFSCGRFLGRRLQLTNGGVVYAVVPCGPRGNSSTAWVDDRTSCGLECGTTPRLFGLPAREF